MGFHRDRVRQLARGELQRALDRELLVGQVVKGSWQIATARECAVSTRESLRDVPGWELAPALCQQRLSEYGRKRRTKGSLMAKKPVGACAGCGKSMWRDESSPAIQHCHECRRAGRSGAPCATEGCEKSAAFVTNSRPAWCEPCIDAMFMEVGAVPLEPFDKPASFRLTRCATCGYDLSYRFEYVLEKRSLGEAVCRVCHWKSWAAWGRAGERNEWERALVEILDHGLAAAGIPERQDIDSGDGMHVGAEQVVARMDIEDEIGRAHV